MTCSLQFKKFLCPSSRLYLLASSLNIVDLEITKNFMKKTVRFKWKGIWFRKAYFPSEEDHYCLKHGPVILLEFSLAICICIWGYKAMGVLWWISVTVIKRSLSLKNTILNKLQEAFILSKPPDCWRREVRCNRKRALDLQIVSVCMYSKCMCKSVYNYAVCALQSGANKQSFEHGACANITTPAE